MEENYITSPRAVFDNDALENQRKGVERFIMGSKSSGIVFDMTEDGIEVNGYYEGFNSGDTKYANIINPILISWADFDKMRYAAENRNSRNIPDFIDKVPDKDYLSKLPIVHINDKEYYIDSTRRERRTVSNPKNVYKF